MPRDTLYLFFLTGILSYFFMSRVECSMRSPAIFSDDQLSCFDGLTTGSATDEGTCDNVLVGTLMGPVEDDLLFYDDSLVPTILHRRKRKPSTNGEEFVAGGGGGWTRGEEQRVAFAAGKMGLKRKCFEKAKEAGTESSNFATKIPVELPESSPGSPLNDEKEPGGHTGSPLFKPFLPWMSPESGVEGGSVSVSGSSILLTDEHRSFLTESTIPLLPVLTSNSPSHSHSPFLKSPSHSHNPLLTPSGRPVFSRVVMRCASPVCNFPSMIRRETTSFNLAGLSPKSVGFRPITSSDSDDEAEAEDEEDEEEEESEGHVPRMNGLLHMNSEDEDDFDSELDQLNFDGFGFCDIDENGRLKGVHSI